MASKAQLDTLTKRHQELEAAIASEIKHPAFDELHVVELKRQKLRIKDQMETLRSQMKPN
jgi:hypothetical protein